MSKKYFDSRQRYVQKENDFFSSVQKLLESNGLEFRDFVRNFSALIRRRDITRLLAHYDIFSEIKAVPGSIAEVGAYRGAGLITWHHFLETFFPGDRGRRVFGFDNFKGYSSIQEEHLRPWVENVLTEMSSSEEFLQTLIELHNDDSFLPGINRTELYSGELHETLPRFLSENPGIRLSLLYLDIGTYAETKIALEHLYPIVVNGGAIVLNGYGIRPWAGEGDAVDQFIATNDVNATFKKIPYSQLPNAYWIKND